MIHLGNAPAREHLSLLASRWRERHLAQVIDDDPQRRAAMAVSACGLRLDYGRQRLDSEVMQALLLLAEQAAMPQAIADLLAGEKLNSSEQRAAWHTALRADRPPAAVADEVLSERARQRAFVASVHAGERLNADGQPFTDVINIGLGGSDLGPRLLCRALQSPQSPMRAHFFGNLDSADLDRRLAQLDPRRCLCVVVSKTFTTMETMQCAQRVRAWLEAGGASVSRHCIAVTARPELAGAFGIDPAHVFSMWDWVGGRFSVWSAVGLAVALSQGWSVFADLLAGAASMDEHFATAAPAENLPVVWALLGIWNRNFLNFSTQVTAVYSDALEHLPNWLQQLEMESNGKSIGRDGAVLDHACSPVQWGGVGTSAQHAFFQMLHQGADAHPVDFVLPRLVPDANPDMQRALLANALAQSAALSHGSGMLDQPGLSAAEQAWRRCPGNRPSSLIWLDTLDARGLGALLAAYEHRCFAQGWLWGLNSFDQFGVELGKQLAGRIESGLAGDEAAWPDALLARQAEYLKA